MCDSPKFTPILLLVTSPSNPPQPSHTDNCHNDLWFPAHYSTSASRVNTRRGEYTEYKATMYRLYRTKTGRTVTNKQSVIPTAHTHHRASQPHQHMIPHMTKLTFPTHSLRIIRFARHEKAWIRDKRIYRALCNTETLLIRHLELWVEQCFHTVVTHRQSERHTQKCGFTDRVVITPNRAVPQFGLLGRKAIRILSR